MHFFGRSVYIYRNMFQVSFGRQDDKEGVCSFFARSTNRCERAGAAWLEGKMRDGRVCSG